MSITIHNSKDAAISGGKWSNPGATFYDDLMECDNWKELLKEAYLIAPTSYLYRDTPFSRSGCKYPHHSIKNGKLVVNKEGLMAAYRRAKQQKAFSGKLKSHLMKHFEELDLEVTITESGEFLFDKDAEVYEKIEENFHDIYLHLMEKTGINLFGEDHVSTSFYESPSTDSNTDQEEKSDEKEKNKDEEYVPIFGVAKKYDQNPLKPDGTPKTGEMLASVKFAKVFGKLTRGDNYSHAVVAFDKDLTDMFSYEASGFVEDSIENEKWFYTEDIYICVMFVKKSDRDRMRKFVDHLISVKDQTRYAYSNFVRGLFGKPIKSDTRFFCSAFTTYIMQCSNPKNLTRNYGVQRPEDITILPRAFYVANVKNSQDFEKKKSQIQEKVKHIYEDHIEEIRDYNSHLPKLLMVEKLGKLKTLDKILDWIMGSIGGNYA